MSTGFTTLAVVGALVGSSLLAANSASAAPAGATVLDRVPAWAIDISAGRVTWTNSVGGGGLFSSRLRAPTGAIEAEARIPIAFDAGHGQVLTSGNRTAYNNPAVTTQDGDLRLNDGSSIVVTANAHAQVQSGTRTLVGYPVPHPAGMSDVPGALLYDAVTGTSSPVADRYDSADADLWGNRLVLDGRDGVIRLKELNSDAAPMVVAGSAQVNTYDASVWGDWVGWSQGPAGLPFMRDIKTTAAPTALPSGYHLVRMTSDGPELDHRVRHRPCQVLPAAIRLQHVDSAAEPDQRRQRLA